MPEQQSLAIEPAAPAAVVTPKPVAPVRKFVLPAESAPAPKAEAPPPAAAAEAAQTKAEEAPAETPDAETKPEKEVSPEEAEKRRESRRFERRIDKATRRAAEAEARAKLAEERYAQMQPKAPVDETAPTLEKFDYDPEKYAAAKAEHAKKQAVKEHEEKQKVEKQKASREKLLTTWAEKADKASDKYDDWESVVGEMKPDSALHAAIMKCDSGDVAYHLAKHPKEIDRLAELEPVDQILAIGRLEAKLAATPEKPKAPSKAPEPIKPLSGAGSVKSDVPSEQDDTATWIKKRQKQVHGRR